MILHEGSTVNSFSISDVSGVLIESSGIGTFDPTPPQALFSEMTWLSGTRQACSVRYPTRRVAMSRVRLVT